MVLYTEDENEQTDREAMVAHQKKGPCEGTTGRQPSVAQAETPRGKLI